MSVDLYKDKFNSFDQEIRFFKPKTVIEPRLLRFLLKGNVRGHKPNTKCNYDRF